MINPLGEPIEAKNDLSKISERREIESEVLGITARARVKKPFLTGISLIDLVLPIGAGQKELIVGDRKTGKTSLLLTTMKNQSIVGTIIIYCLIGKKTSELKKINEYLSAEKIKDNLIIVAATAADPPGLIYLAPYSAMAIAEYFRDAGRDVLVIYDDLSNHARFYREISLMARRFPGRESYPGDIFYSHARLMEKAGNFRHPEKGEVSITCLPVVETVEGDLTGFIATNVMGMTDGHIFFDSNIFQKGQRPAINLFLSVTRVGKQTKDSLRREIIRELTAFLARFEQTESFAHFGAELSSQIQQTLETGTAFYELFEQERGEIFPEAVQTILFALIWAQMIKKDDVLNYKKCLLEAFNRDATKSEIIKMVSAENLIDLVNNVKNNQEFFDELCSKKNPS